jgi:hypothetical protein
MALAVRSVWLQQLDIPMTLKALYKTVWEIKQRQLVDMAADRGAFIDQSQSFNVHMSDPNFGKLTSLHFYTWKKGLKTGALARRQIHLIPIMPQSAQKTAVPDCVPCSNAGCCRPMFVTGLMVATLQDT